MQSFNLHSIPSPCPNLPIPNSPQIPHSSLHHPSPRRDVFSDILHSLRKCAEDQRPESISCHHARALKSGIESDVFISNSLLNVYSKCGQIQDTRNLFDEMPHRTIVSWTSMMSAYYRIGEAEAAVALFWQMLERAVQPNEYTLAVALQACALTGDASLIKAIHCYAVKNTPVLDGFLQNCLIDAYAKLGRFESAEKLLWRLCSRDVVSWTSVISGFVRYGNVERALALFCGMQEDGIVPNEVTMVTILLASSGIGDCKIMGWILGLVLKGNWCAHSIVLNSLIEMYSKNGRFVESLLVFCRFCFGNDGLYPSLETMANILQGCANCGSVKMGKGIHGYLIKHGLLPCVVVENSLINMYMRNGLECTAMVLFRKMLTRDVISWNTIISGSVKNGKPMAALGLLVELHRECFWENVSPDFVTVLVSLEACSELALLLQGQVIHSYLVKTGLLGDVFVQNALIEMYAKSGRVDFAKNVYTEMHETDVASWNSIIAAYGINGDGTSALNALSQLGQSVNVKPNSITFVNVLSACAHVGLVNEGLEIFNSMERRYGVKPSMEHFACVVDLLGRAGRAQEAERFIHNMPIRPGPDVWGALLSACVLTENITMAERVAKELAILEPGSSVWRVALSNAYAGVGKWDEAAEIRAEVRASKEGGWSSVNVGGSELSFMAGDTMCPKSAVVYEILSCLKNHMKDGSSVASEFVLF